MTATTRRPTQALASFLASLCYEDLPEGVVGRTEEFFLGWVASAGRDARPVRALEGFVRKTGPPHGPLGILSPRR